MNARRPTAPPAWRLYLIGVFLVLLALALVARIISLQIIDTERGYRFLQAQGDARSVRTEKILARRGMLLDRNGEPLAVSTPVFSLSANPRVFAADDAQMSELARLLRLDRVQLEKRLLKLKEQGRSYVSLKSRQPPAVASAIAALGIKGIYRDQEFKRYYPAGEVTSHLLGFTDIEENGQEGLERAYNQHLMATHGSKQVVRDQRGRNIAEVRQIKQAQVGQDLQLSIDLRMQYAAHMALKQTVNRFGAQGGSLVILDVHTGEVLAISNQPSYNPNNRARLKIEHMRNRALTDVFEPGSTVKPFTIAAALSSGIFSPSTIIDTNPGGIRVGKKWIPDHHNYGELSITDVLAKSSQVGVTKIALQLDPHSVREQFYQVGLGQVSATGFPGERTGTMPSHRHWRDIERATFAYGYGLTVTPLQLAQAYQVLAAGGVMHPVSFLKRNQVESNRVMDETIANQVVDMLGDVALAGGTAAKAAIPAFSFAGKTGTVHKVKVGGAGYEESRYRSVFAGMAPADNPRIVGVVVIDDPQGDDYYGGLVAAPVFTQVVSDVLPILEVAPDKLEDFATSPYVVAGGQL